MRRERWRYDLVSTSSGAGAQGGAGGAGGGMGGALQVKLEGGVRIGLGAVENWVLGVS